MEIFFDFIIFTCGVFIGIAIIHFAELCRFEKRKRRKEYSEHLNTQVYKFFEKFITRVPEAEMKGQKVKESN